MGNELWLTLISFGKKKGFIKPIPMYLELRLSWFELSFRTNCFNKFCTLLCRSPGYAVLPQVQKTSADSANTESSGPAFIGQPQQQFAIPGGPSNSPFPQSPHCIFVPFQTPGANVTYGDRFGSNLNIPDSQLEAQKKLLSNQIEVQ